MEFIDIFRVQNNLFVDLAFITKMIWNLHFGQRQLSIIILDIIDHYYTLGLLSSFGYAEI